MEGRHFKVAVEQQYSEIFEINIVLTQVDALSPQLFYKVLEHIIGNEGTNFNIP